MLCCGRRFGKDTLGHNLFVETALAGYPTGWFDPSYRMLTETWREISRLMKPIASRIRADEHRIELVTGGTMDMWSLDSPDLVRGRKYKRVIINEAAMIPHLMDAWRYAIRPMLADFSGDAWFMSTPKGFNDFHELWGYGQDPRYSEWASWQQPTWANPYIRPSEIEAMRLEMPENVYSQEIAAQFVQPGGAIFERDWFDGNRFDPDSQSEKTRVIARYHSWDTALKDKAENAYTALTVGELMPDYRLNIREVWRERLQFPALPAAIERFAQRDSYDGKLRAVLIEDKASGISAIQTLQQTAQPWLRDLITPFAPGPYGAKEERANQAAVWCRNGCVRLPVPGDSVTWLTDAESEIFAFPESAQKDQVDCFTQLVLYLEHFLAEGMRARMSVQGTN